MDVVRAFTKVLSVLLSLLLGWTPFYKESAVQGELDREEQIRYIAVLEELYESGEAVKCDDAEFFLGNLDEALASGVKFNEMAFIGTHNSYQTPSVASVQTFFGILDKITFGLAVGEDSGKLNSPKLTEQLNCGIRNLEIDIEATYDENGYSFNCFHVPMLDMTTNSYDLSLALKEIKMWSDYNPEHLPVTVIIEPKKAFAPMENMEYFSMDSVKALDVLLRDTFGDTLFTPADMLKDYENFAELRKADGWAEVSSMLGKVVVLLHETNVTEDYIKLDESIKSQAMFPMLRPDDTGRDCTSFIIMNDAEKFSKDIEKAVDDGFIVRVRADLNSEKNEEQAKAALSSKAQLIATDYPVYKGLRDDGFVSFDENKLIKIVNK